MSKLANSTKSCVELPEDDDAIISNLPEDIRCRIISFLNTRDAVATTVLSTKWKNLWTTSLINIDFRDEEFDCEDDGDCKANRIKFSQIVGKVLDSHNLPVIKRFHLDCAESSLYDVYRWVSMVILKKVEDVYLSIGPDGAPLPDGPLQLPTGETLEVLTLSYLIIIRMVALCYLPKLKKLVLEYIRYENDESALMLISSCPSLESLTISRDGPDGVQNFIITGSAMLKHLCIQQVCWDPSDFSNACNYVINASGLQQLVLSEVPIEGVVIENLSSLEKTDISFSDAIDIGMHDDKFHTLLQGICNSENLKISNMSQFCIPSHLFPKFDRLSSLEVDMKCCSWHSLQDFIMNSDRLDVLKFRKYSCEKKKHLVCWRWNPKTVPICLLSSLKTMTFSGFNGLTDELRMVEYMLKNAKFMQEMKICFEYSLPNTKSEPQLRQKLLKFSRGSEECQVLIILR